MNAARLCTAPVRGHQGDTEAAADCPVHGQKSSAARKTVETPPLIGRPPSPPAETFAAAGADDEVINGLIVREEESTGKYVLAHAETGEPLVPANRRASLGRRGRPFGEWDSESDAAEWARKSYPLAAKVANRLGPAGRARYYCSFCQEPMFATGDVWKCDNCNFERDYS